MTGATKYSGKNSNFGFCFHCFSFRRLSGRDDIIDRIALC